MSYYSIDREEKILRWQFKERKDLNSKDLKMCIATPGTE